MPEKKHHDHTMSRLDASLLSYINSEPRWQAFKQHLVMPLMVKRRSAVTGNIEYSGYPAGCNPLDKVRIDATFLGSSQHLLLISLIYHMNHVNRSPGTLTCLDVASHFTVHSYHQHFANLIEHVIDADSQTNPDKREEILSLVRIWDARIGDYIQAYQLTYDFMVDCAADDPDIYDWQIQDYRTTLTLDDRKHAAWSKRFTPLQYYQWMIPNSRLSTLDFYLDPNTSYMYSWLQDYLAKCRLYRNKITELAKAIKTREAYQKKLDKLSHDFVKRNKTLANGIRANLSRGAPSDPAQRQRDAIQRQFLHQASLLYNRFLKQINATIKK